MAPEAQRILIAEACGWKNIFKEPTFISDDSFPRGMPPDQTSFEEWGTLPDYLNDLNACLPLLGTDWDCRTRNGVNFITIYRPSKQHEAFGENLCHVICEAFLRTIGKWVDSAPAQKP
jgi:hypothetical protein